MEWLANALIKGVENVYLESTGANQRLTLLNGAVVRLVDGVLYIGGEVVGKTTKRLVVVIWLADDTEVRISDMECDLLEEKYFNASSKQGKTKVLYKMSRNDVTVELTGTL